ncbi:hypothetical protein [Clavibacter lycopersici]|uniref:hypothetical protein n=1 Tax=Clavibacter lycopersici TaxID=2301718 RepID=UPI0011C214FD|nr:hypothetical protein [Clavibacter lycopersici]
MIALIIVGAATAYLMRKVAAPLVPGTSALVESLWTAAFVAVCAGFIFSLIGTRESRETAMTGEYLSRRAITDVGLSTVDYAYGKAIASGADPILIRAILFAEVIQRPRWVRNLEKWSWWIRRRGTYGVMQVAGRRPVTDYDSIDQTCTQYAGAWGASLSTEGGYDTWTTDWRGSWAELGYRNGDAVFIDMVNQIYATSFYAYSYQGQPSNIRGNLHIYQIRRYATQFALRGITSASYIVIRYMIDGNLVVVGSAKPGVYRDIWAWELCVPPASEHVALMVFASNGDEKGSAECSLDVSALDWETPFA